MRASREKETPLCRAASSSEPEDFLRNANAKIFQTCGDFSGYARGMTRKPEDIPLLFPDPVIKAYLKDVDRTLIRSMLQKSSSQRAAALVEMNRAAIEGRHGESQLESSAGGRHRHGMTTITLGENGTLVLPEALRNGLHLKRGAQLEAALIGDHIELKPCAKVPNSWPPGFFDRITIHDPAFGRPPQGMLPTAVEL